MTKNILWASLLILIGTLACNKVLLHSKDRPMDPVEMAFATSVSDALASTRKALDELGYKIEMDDEVAGKITTGWIGTKASSHYVDLFDRRDYGTVGAYYRLEIEAREKNGQAELSISAPVRSVVGRIKSAKSEEKRLLKKVADLLRREDFEMTNVGVQ